MRFWGTAGSGDVLAGIAGAILATEHDHAPDSVEARIAPLMNAVRLHGYAARVAEQEHGAFSALQLARCVAHAARARFAPSESL